MKEMTAPDAVWVQKAQEMLEELLSKPPCHCEEDCMDKLLMGLLSGTASKMDQIKVGIWLDSVSRQLASSEKDREFARGMVLLIAGPRQKTKPH